MKELQFGNSRISSDGPAYVIAEIGHNHQGNLETALKMIEVAKGCGVNAVKFQKRNNRKLYTTKYYDRPYDNENSYGKTYGEHREFLEFGENEYRELMKCARAHNVEFMATAFDFESVDFLQALGVSSYKIASGDVTSLPLISYIAKLRKPIFLSTGAATMEEVDLAYATVRKEHDMICLLHCTAGYPTEYQDLNLRVISTMRTRYPDAIIGYSGHDNGILAPVLAYMLGAVVMEKHFTLNHSWKGTDHHFSLEPEGMRKQVRDLARVRLAMGSGEKTIAEFEKSARSKMGKSIYAARALPAGTVLSEADLVIKSPGDGLPPYFIERIVGKKLLKPLNEEDLVALDALGDA